MSESIRLFWACSDFQSGGALPRKIALKTGDRARARERWGAANAQMEQTLNIGLTAVRREGQFRRIPVWSRGVRWTSQDHEDTGDPSNKEPGTGPGSS